MKQTIKLNISVRKQRKPHTRNACVAVLKAMYPPSFAIPSALFEYMVKSWNRIAVKAPDIKQIAVAALNTFDTILFCSFLKFVEVHL